jgi:hypothetical protein
VHKPSIELDLAAKNGVDFETFEGVEPNLVSLAVSMDWVAKLPFL